MVRRRLALVVAMACVAACEEPPPLAPIDAGALDAGPAACATPPVLTIGDANGHPEPLGSGPTEARAGRISAAELPALPSGLPSWGSGDFVLANDRVAVTIEDVGPSDLYDPWGGRISGIARVEGGALVEPADFAEFFVLTGRYTVVTDSVTVMNDGSDGQPAVIRAAGALRPLPFFEAITQSILSDDYSDISAAIDYSLAPGSNQVEIRTVYASPRTAATRVTPVLHGFMGTDRMRPFVANAGFDHTIPSIDWLGFADDRLTSFLYEIDRPLGAVIDASGFLGRLEFHAKVIPGCVTTSLLHGRITIGGPGLDGALVARAEARGETLRELRGVAREPDGTPAEGVRVHALSSAGDWLTRSSFTGADGAFSVHVPEGVGVRLDPYRLGNGPGVIVDVPAGATTIDVPVPPSGFVELRVTDDLGAPLPARMQVLALGADVPEPPSRYGEADVPDGRVAVAYTETGLATVRVPVGSYRVVASRGYEYELGDFPSVAVTTAGETVSLSATLTRSVETPLVQCGDFHLHTRRSIDAPDDALRKVRAAVSEGLEIPVRSEHEYVADFQPEIAALGMERFAHGIASVELTSMELWGHMGVFPLVADPTQINGGAPRWQTYPTPEAMSTPFRTLGPAEVLRAVRARPEAPVVIVNHPMGSTNYFGYVGYDNLTGAVARPQDWDEEFGLVECFNGSDWRDNRDRCVASWLSLLDHGRVVYAVGSSDSHGISNSPVGYPRTCVELGSDDPRDVVPNTLRDQLAAGHATISGGIYVDTLVGDSGPGDTATGLGPRAAVHVRVQAASWVDVDALDVVVDGVTVETVAILPGDADPAQPTVRFAQDVLVDVAPAGSYVIVAAYGDAPLEPVHRGRIPFGVTNPIFLHP
jgi:hypothetical protein